MLNTSLGHGDPKSWALSEWEIKAVAAAWARIGKKSEALGKVLENVDVAGLVVIHGAYLARNLIKVKTEGKKENDDTQQPRPVYNGNGDGVSSDGPGGGDIGTPIIWPE